MQHPAVNTTRTPPSVRGVHPAGRSVSPKPLSADPELTAALFVPCCARGKGLTCGRSTARGSAEVAPLASAAGCSLIQRRPVYVHIAECTTNRRNTATLLRAAAQRYVENGPKRAPVDRACDLAVCCAPAASARWQCSGASIQTQSWSEKLSRLKADPHCSRTLECPLARCISGSRHDRHY